MSVSIYHHLPGKAAVVSGLVEQVFSQIHATAPAAGSSWQDRVKEAARAYRRTLRAGAGGAAAPVHRRRARRRRGFHPRLHAGRGVEHVRDLRARTGPAPRRRDPAALALGEDGLRYEFDSAFETGLDVLVKGIEAVARGGQ
jgi:TetR/AcrR family transcriptional regulator, tetracycline repressor protein